MAFAVSQATLCNGLPRGVEVMPEPNNFGSLLDPNIYRDIKISCMYLVEDVEAMLVPALEVPAGRALVAKLVFLEMMLSRGQVT